MQSPHRARAHLDDRLVPLRSMPGLARPPRGWVRAVRDALGMTTAQLGRRLNVDQSRITKMEQAEVEDAVTLKTLRLAAEGLGCTLVYAFVPNPSLEDAVRRRAEHVADRTLASVDHTMRLENQGLNPDDLARERERLVAELLSGSPRRLWDEP